MAGNFTICVGTVGSGAWLSPDGGESWRRVAKGLGNESRVFGLSVHPMEPRTIFAGAPRIRLTSLKGSRGAS